MLTITREEFDSLRSDQTVTLVDGTRVARAPAKDSEGNFVFCEPEPDSYFPANPRGGYEKTAVTVPAGHRVVLIERGTPAYHGTIAILPQCYPKLSCEV